MTFKALLYLDVACSRVSLWTVLRDVYLIVQLGYPAITNIFFGTVTLRYSGVPLYRIFLEIAFSHE